jgi:hypothetical protein
MLKAVSAHAGDGARVLIQWASGRTQYISGTPRDCTRKSELVERATQL